MSMASPTEASGTVTNVVDGDTFDIRIETTDPRAIYEIERVRLADVDCPEMSTPEGPIAKDFARAILLNRTVWLDIDDRAEGGRGPYDRLICVVYLTASDGQPIASPPFNRILVDSGHAEVKDYDTNEFDPDEWWPAGGTAGFADEITGNQRPLINSLDTTKASPQTAGESIIFNAKATDADGDLIYYQFWQNGPATGGIWRVVRAWGVTGTWMKTSWVR